MKRQGVVHDTFTIERTYRVAPHKVFRAFADVDAKKRWFHGPPGWTSAVPHTMDFRVGGTEHEEGGPPGGPVHTMDATYLDIVDNERIIYSYSMTLDGDPISVSLATVELDASGDGTRLVLTEHSAHFDSPHYGAALAGAGRLEGTNELLDQLGAALAGD